MRSTWLGMTTVADKKAEKSLQHLSQEIYFFQDLSDVYDLKSLSLSGVIWKLCIL